MAPKRLWRTLSAFHHSARRWAPILSSNAQCQVTQRRSLTPASLTPRNVDTISRPTLSLVSWNIDAFSSRPIARAKLILNRILEAPEFSNIVFLQEVAPGVRDFLLNDVKVRDAFLVTDAEDQTSFQDVPFATMTLLSSGRFASGVDSQKKEGDGIEGGAKGGGKVMLGRVSRVTLPSKWREILANVLREPRCGGGIIAGDFNAINPEDHALVDKNELVDAWITLHGTADADEATWGFDVELRDGLAPGRLDKVAMLGVKAEKMEVLRPGFIEVPRPAEKPLKIPLE